jgi:hypothetical protein
VKDHKAGNAKALQKSGTEEEIDEFIENLDELVDLAATTSRDVEKKAAARAQQKKLDDDGKCVRAAAFTGLQAGEDERRTKRPKTDAGQVQEGMNEQLQALEAEKQRLDKVDEKRHQEMMGVLCGMKGEMTASRVEFNRQFEAQKAYNKEQRARDRALRDEVRGLGGFMSRPAGERVHFKAGEDSGRRDGEQEVLWEDAGDFFFEE